MTAVAERDTTTSSSSWESMTTSTATSVSDTDLSHPSAMSVTEGTETKATTATSPSSLGQSLSAGFTTASTTSGESSDFDNSDLRRALSAVVVVPPTENPSQPSSRDHTFYDGAQLFDPSWAKDTSLETDVKRALVANNRYIGINTPSVAEAKCQRRSEWFLYHQSDVSLAETASEALSHSKIPYAAPLTVIYRRTSDGGHSHFPVRFKHIPAGSLAKVCYVDYGDPEAPVFQSVSQLAHFYKTNCYAKHDLADRITGNVEVFPVWNAHGSFNVGMDMLGPRMASAFDEDAPVSLHDSSFCL